MIQRFLYSLLKAGVEDIHADPAVLDTMLQDWKLPAAEMAVYRELWRAKLPTVKHAYARVDDSFPLYSVVLASEGESDLLLGNDAGVLGDPDDPDYECDVLGSVWDHTYQILCYTEHPEVTLIAYEVAKAILIPAMKTLAEDAVFRMRMSGADLMPDPRYLPSHLFARQLTFQCSRPFTVVDVDSRLQRVRAVTGIHVDRAGGRGDAGPVRTLVTPYAAEDED